MKKENTQTTCPECGHSYHIDVNEILYSQIENEVKSEYLKKSSIDKKQIEEKIRKQVSEEANTEIESYKEQLEIKSAQVKELNKTKAELVRVNREKDELKEKIEAETEEKFSKILKEEKNKIRKTVEDGLQLKMLEKENLISQLTEQMKDLQKKAEQGSVQRQGETQELLIEDWLETNFPLDEIREIKKGARGADCLQIISTRTKNNVGSIYYESKRTKEFQSGWIEKFKEDMRVINATAGILVTDAFPKDQERLFQKDGIWICSLEEFKGLSFVLRESVILLGEAIATQENKGDKMNMLYDFLTGSEFRMQIEAIVEAFTQMETDLQSEKRSMESIWKKREKQIQKVLLNTTHMYSSIKGIAGVSVKSIPLLELPDSKG